jgi:hypothetical protein
MRSSPSEDPFRTDRGRGNHYKLGETEGQQDHWDSNWSFGIEKRRNRNDSCYLAPSRQELKSPLDVLLNFN